jgi:hypothetical protein
MRPIALIVAALALPAYAEAPDWFARTRNESGGEIVLLTNQGQCPAKGMRMFAASSSGRVIWGCWLASSTHIHVAYDNGESRAYDMNGWTVHPAFLNQRGPGI